MADEETSKPPRKHQLRLHHDGRQSLTLSPGKLEGMAVEMHVGQGFLAPNINASHITLDGSHAPPAAACWNAEAITYIATV